MDIVKTKELEVTRKESKEGNFVKERSKEVKMVRVELKRTF